MPNVIPNSPIPSTQPHQFYYSDALPSDPLLQRQSIESLFHPVVFALSNEDAVITVNQYLIVKYYFTVPASRVIVVTDWQTHWYCY